MALPNRCHQSCLAPSCVHVAAYMAKFVPHKCRHHAPIWNVANFNPWKGAVPMSIIMWSATARRSRINSHLGPFRREILGKRRQGWHFKAQERRPSRLPALPRLSVPFVPRYYCHGQSFVVPVASLTQDTSRHRTCWFYHRLWPPMAQRDLISYQPPGQTPRRRKLLASGKSKLSTQPTLG